MRAIEKVAISFGLFLACIGIYFIISILFINRTFNTSKYAKEISEMEIYAHDIILDKPSKYESKYIIIDKEIENTTNSDMPFFTIVLLHKNSDIRVTAKYPIKVIKNEIIVDEKNPTFTVNNTNIKGLKLLLIIILIITYIRIYHHLVIKKYQ